MFVRLQNVLVVSMFLLSGALSCPDGIDPTFPDPETIAGEASDGPCLRCPNEGRTETGDVQGLVVPDECDKDAPSVPPEILPVARLVRSSGLFIAYGDDDEGERSDGSDIQVSGSNFV